MKFFTGIALFGSMAAAVPAGVLVQRASPLKVNIDVSDIGNIKAKITNNGKTALKLLRPGSILDKTAVEKTSVFAGSEKIAFDGVRVLVATTNLDAAAFRVIQPGQTISASWDAAQVHDLAGGGFYDIAVTGSLSYAEEDSNDITGSVPLTSNVVTTSIDGAAAAKVRRDFHESLSKRSIADGSCAEANGTAPVTRTALSNCRALAIAAYAAAVGGPAAKMIEYFKSASSATRTAVASVFNKIATECGSSTSGVSTTYCMDKYPGGACGSGVLAYTLPSQSYMVNCPLYFTALTPLTTTCHGQDQATTTLHEVTHLSQIKGATDQGGCYGYACMQTLTQSQSIMHADTYALFANAINAGC
ncbi:Deuterolysin metalloprotease family-domain-containing protein [Rhypophila decipiens]|uniref:Neutral protease 2 n=1 Tax=Rhypophila decipiens TaxID=261697 RepID=A0AAN7B5R2_9PEZI|nr:Deuterolysin metalloprotease family-domain-containing protein [Rhypophila decipiens]